MTYKINGVALSLQPESGKWIIEPPLGFSGFGHPIYPAVKSFEMQFGLMDLSSFSQLQAAWAAVSYSGTVSVHLPRFGHTSWEFREYSGCVIHAPAIEGTYFEEHQMSVVMTISNIRTE